MKTDSKQNIDRLMRCAAMAKPTESLAMPYGFDTRVLASLRGGGFVDDLGAVLAIARRALGVSLAVALIVAGFGWYETHRPSIEPDLAPPDALNLAFVR